MNPGIRIELGEKDIPKVQALLLELEKRNGSIGGIFSLDDCEEEHTTQGNVKRFISRLGEKSNARIHLGRDYFQNRGLEIFNGLAIRAAYLKYGDEQFIWYHCPQTFENISLFDRYLR